MIVIGRNIVSIDNFGITKASFVLCLIYIYIYICLICMYIFVIDLCLICSKSRLSYII